MTENNKTTGKIDPPVYYWVTSQLHLIVLENGNLYEGIPTNPCCAHALRMLREIAKRTSNAK